MADVISGGQMTIAARLGGSQLDGPSDFTGVTSESIKCLIRRVTDEATADTIDASGMCDIDRVIQTFRKARTLTLELMVPRTGMQFEGRETYYIEIIYKEISTVSVGKTRVGVITRHTYSSEDGQIQTESITVECNANGHDYS
jgi:hypothetical protein